MIVFRSAVTAVCVLGVAAALATYPLPAWPIGCALILYGAALWRWPALWLAVVPATLPAVDLAPWTGWMYVGESDLFILATIGVLTLRAPPGIEDLLPKGRARWVIALAAIACFVCATEGLTSAFDPPGGSDNPYLRPDNALRLAKGFAAALALFPFLRSALRARPNAMSWFAGGMLAGLALVSVAAIVERLLFVGLFDFSSDYRVVATFSSMHIGGGHIGAYLVMALPFLPLLFSRPRASSLLLAAGLGAIAGYALVVTFARTAYAAAFASAGIVAVAWIFAGRRGSTTERRSIAAPVLLFLVLGGGIVAATIGASYMRERIETVDTDYLARESNLEAGMALRDRDLATALIGMGLGTYPRVLLARGGHGAVPTNFIIRSDGQRNFLAIEAASSLYFGQKVALEAGQPYLFSALVRAASGKARLSVSLCEKMMLYSVNCTGADFVPDRLGVWQTVSAQIRGPGSPSDPSSGLLPRPIELDLFDLVPGTTVEVASLRLMDAQGRDLLENGDFTRGTDRWYFNDDDHLVWRIKNQYAMSFFEGGALGLLAFLVVAGAGLAGACAGIGRGQRLYASVAASLTGFLGGCLFDALLEAPRLATLFYLLCFIGLEGFSQPRSRPDVSA